MKNIKAVFLKWILFVSLISIGIVVAFMSGLVTDVYKVDFTKISFAIMLAFCYYSIQTGKLTYKICKYQDKETIFSIENEGEDCWFYSDCFTYAGMIGTVIGFILMMKGSFINITQANIQNIIMMALSRMGLALYTTAAGLIFSLLLKIQLRNLYKYLDRIKHEKNLL